MSDDEGSPDPRVREFLDLWGIQDSLLQSYRLIFLTAEFILASVAAVVLVGPASAMRLSVSAALIVLGLVFLYQWRDRTVARGWDVYWAQLQVMRVQDGQGVSPHWMKKFKEFEAKDPGEKKEELQALTDDDALFELLVEEQPTRDFLNEWVPLAFLGFWIILLALLGGKALGILTGIAS